MPKFSIIIATYNQLETLKVALEALKQQTLDSFDVHICDDGSTDGTQAYAIAECASMNQRQYARGLWHYHWQENKGNYGANINQGVRAARGEYCVFMSADSFMEPDYLHILSEYVAPHRVVCGIRFQVDGGQGVDVDFRLKKNAIPPFPTIIAAHPWMHLTGNGLTIPTYALQTFGGFDERFKTYGGDDGEMIARLYYKGYVFWSVPDLHLYHHWHKSKEAVPEINKILNETIKAYAA